MEPLYFLHQEHGQFVGQANDDGHWDCPYASLCGKRGNCPGPGNIIVVPIMTDMHGGFEFMLCDRQTGKKSPQTITYSPDLWERGVFPFKNRNGQVIRPSEVGTYWPKGPAHLVALIGLLESSLIVHTWLEALSWAKNTPDADIQPLRSSPFIDKTGPPHKWIKLMV